MKKKKKVLVVVDVQNDFVKGGALAYGYPERDITGDIELEVKTALALGDYVVGTLDTHGENYLETLEGKLLPVKHCTGGTPGWEPVPWLYKLSKKKQVRLFTKNTFGHERLQEILEDFEYLDDVEIEEIKLIGFCTSICVLANAVMLRAHFPNTRIVVQSDLCGDINKESHLAALKVLRNQQIEVI